MRKGNSQDLVSVECGFVVVDDHQYSLADMVVEVAEHCTIVMRGSDFAGIFASVLIALIQ